MCEIDALPVQLARKVVCSQGRLNDESRRNERRYCKLDLTIEKCNSQDNDCCKKLSERGR